VTRRLGDQVHLPRERSVEAEGALRRRRHRGRWASSKATGPRALAQEHSPRSARPGTVAQEGTLAQGALLWSTGGAQAEAPGAQVHLPWPKTPSVPRM
jgi:hypothetical protein